MEADVPFEPVLTDLSAPPPADVTARVAALSPAPSSVAPQSPQEARSRLDVLIADAKYGERLLAGDVEATREWNRLQELASKTNPVAAGPPPDHEIFHTTVDGQLPPRAVASFVAFAREQFGFNDVAIGQILSGEKHSPELVARATAIRAFAMRSPEFVRQLNAGDPNAHRVLLEANAILAAGAK
jgi:hypothetical protein